MIYDDNVKYLIIRQVRRKLGLKQIDFGEKLGVSTSTVSQWEMLIDKDGVSQGRRIPRGAAWKMIEIVIGQNGFKFDKNGMLIEPKKRSKDIPRLDKKAAKA
jgi:hypothetical protein